MARTSTRDAIIAAAVAVAARNGISGSSMDDIADEAGVAKGSLYYHFPSKDAIFEHVLHAGFDRLADAVRTAHAEVPGAAGVGAAARAMLEVLQQNPARAKMVASEMFRTDRAWVDVIAPARSTVVVLFRDVLRDAARASGDAASADRITETAGAALFGAIAAAGLEWLLFHPDQPLDAVVDQVLSVARPWVGSSA